MSLSSLLIIPISLIAFAILLMVIVFIHEFGHFSVARMLGIRVDTFSIGFGKPIARFVDRAGTEWRIAMIPLGGYVKFFGDLNAASQPAPSVQNIEDEQVERGPSTTQFPSGDKEGLAQQLTPEERAVCFHFKPVWARALVVAAGPVYNFILAIGIFASLLLIFGQSVISPVIGEVRADTAAMEAGLQPGDRIVAIDARKVREWREIQGFVQLSSNEELTLTIDRGGREIAVPITPRRTEMEDAFGNKTQMGLLGITAAPDAIETRHFGVGAALLAGTKEVWRVISTTVRFVGRLVQGKESAEQLGGPVKMAKYAGQAASSGFSDRISDEASFGDRLTFSLTNFINLAAFISVSIGFLNLLPIPVLDGGHLVYYGVEAVMGKPLGPRVQSVGHQVGFIILISFMIFVTWNDISGLFGAAFSSSG